MGRGERNGGMDGGNLELFRKPRADGRGAAERTLLDLADFVYAHTPLKPMSKTLFLISRCLLACKHEQLGEDPESLVAAYDGAKRELGTAAPIDDFDFRSVLAECGQHLPTIVQSLRRVLEVGGDGDNLGLAFNTLLRGKWEAGEGLGTFLTPEEVVRPMVSMALSALSDEALSKLGTQRTPLLYGDICGGTGRFAFEIAEQLKRSGVSRARVERGARLFDQSSLAIGFARINFALEGIRASFGCVDDSLTSESVSELRGQFAVLATNPPFGSSKYRWTRALEKSLPLALLSKIGIRGENDSADPAELFVFRNLDLLAPGGVVSIVLPDGVVAAPRFKQALEAYERDRGCGVEVVGLVSLPVASFALGGTVAKTSFVVARREPTRRRSRLYLAVAQHVGFIKKGNRRAIDPNGNDLEAIASEFASKKYRAGGSVENWRVHPRLVPAELLHAANREASRSVQPLRDLAVLVKRTAGSEVGAADDSRLHVSVLDVDETGLIDVIAASRNRPSTPGMACRPGDVLISCINPRIWRACMIPEIGGTWSCSPEFAVLRPRAIEEGRRLSVALHQRAVKEAVCALASGTSSSRQRVRKRDVLEVDVPAVDATEETILDHVEARREFYLMRLREARAYEGIHSGEALFKL
jgi:hypothetical protein